MKRLGLTLIAALVAAPALAAGEGTGAVPPPSPRHERMRDFMEISMSPKVLAALDEPLDSISVADPADHAFTLKTTHCTLAVKVVYTSMAGGTGSEISVDVGEARCR